MIDNKQKKQKKENKYITTLKKLYKTKRGKAILFFAFYFIFFFIVISLIRTSYNTPRKDPFKKNNITLSFNLNKIENGNYHFIREEIINNKIKTFTGDKYKERIKGIMTINNQNQNYFIYDNINMLETNNKYEVVNELYYFNNITKDEMIRKIIPKATLISKTEYKNGKTAYNYEITTDTLELINNNKKIDVDMITNKIMLETTNNDVDKISFDLSSYATYLNNTDTTCIINITYSNFNEIKEFSLPTN